MAALDDPEWRHEAREDGRSEGDCPEDGGSAGWLSRNRLYHMWDDWLKSTALALGGSRAACVDLADDSDSFPVGVRTTKDYQGNLHAPKVPMC